MKGIHIDYFSGSIADMKRGKRTEDNALRILEKDGRVSCFDRSEYRWLDVLLCDLEKLGLIAEEKGTAYPWQIYKLTDLGRARIETQAALGALEGK